MPAGSSRPRPTTAVIGVMCLSTTSTAIRMLMRPLLLAAVNLTSIIPLGAGLAPIGGRISIYISPKVNTTVTTASTTTITTITIILL